MEFKVHFTEQCLEDIENICDYISRQFKTDKSAIRLRKEIREKTKQLGTNPEMYESINKIDRLKRTYRKIVINNYILLYTIDNKNKIVYISHMYYGQQNYFEGLI